MSKRVLLINSVLGFGSTGNIVLNLAKEYEQNGYEVKVAYGRTFKVSDDKKADIDKYGVRIGSDMDVNFHVLYTRITDKHGLASVRTTKQFLKWADKYNPDILWIHNIHGYYINYELLFNWIKSRPDMQVKWTLHDCWAFTGHCSHFIYMGCDKWKTACSDCPQLDQYPKSFIDRSRTNFMRKKTSFTGVNNMTIITPSKWLKSKVAKSFLSDYPIEVVYNTIDKEIFKPTINTFKVDHDIQNKKMILGVASAWNERKGLKDFYELSTRLDRNNYKIVLVGLNEHQIKDIKNNNLNIIGLPRTSNDQELAQIYTAADVFVNATYEDTFPTVNMEAESCETPVITYDTGGCAETIHREDSKVVKHGIYNICEALL